MKTHLAAILALHLLLYASICASTDGDKGESQDKSTIGLTVTNFIIGTWKPHFKDVNNCENFRLNTTPPSFRIWPEDMCMFCCEDKLTPHTMASYVHSEKNGRFMNPIKCFDMGIVSAFTSFRSWLLDRISQRDITNQAQCEVNDLKRFYERRFGKKAFAKHGLFSGLSFVLLVEFLVLLAAVPQYVLWTPGSMRWVAILLYNSAVVYTYLSLLSIVSAVLQQIAFWNAVTTIHHLHDMESKVSFKMKMTTNAC